MSEARPGRRTGLTAASITAVGMVVVLALAAAVTSFVLPASALRGDAVKTAAVAIFVASYVALAIGKVPGLSASIAPESRWSAPA